MDQIYLLNLKKEKMEIDGFDVFYYADYSKIKFGIYLNCLDIFASKYLSTRASSKLIVYCLSIEKCKRPLHVLSDIQKSTYTSG